MKRLAILLFFLVAALAVNNCFAMVNMPAKSLSGKEAPAFSLQDLNANTVNSADYLGKKPVLLFFWATWCPHCRAAIKELNKVAPSLESKGAAVITVDIGENKSVVNSYMGENKYHLTVLLDKDSALVEPYGIIGVPAFFLITKDGKIKSEGYSLPQDYEKILLEK